MSTELLRELLVMLQPQQCRNHQSHIGNPILGTSFQACCNVTSIVLKRVETYPCLKTRYIHLDIL